MPVNISRTMAPCHYIISMFLLKCKKALLAANQIYSLILDTCHNYSYSDVKGLICTETGQKV